MKRVGDYFVRVKHMVFVEHDGKTYLREEDITNGRIYVSWTEKIKNERYDNWEDSDDTLDKDQIDILNKEYIKLSNSE